jgi:glutamine---fructose-6-phosphate transaminase (isomerizing)
MTRKGLRDRPTVEWRRCVNLAKMSRMQPNDPKQTQFGLVRDMLSSVEVIRSFKPEVVNGIAPAIAQAGRLLLTGEGSSRIFPSKSALAHSRRRGDRLQVHTDAATQAAEYDHANWAVLGVSNSGRTAEVIRLFTRLEQAGHQHRYALTAHAGSKLESLATRAFTLTCGGEAAVAATKSVLEQALFERALVDSVAGRTLDHRRLNATAEAVHAALTLPIDRGSSKRSPGPARSTGPGDMTAWPKN